MTRVVGSRGYCLIDQNSWMDCLVSRLAGWPWRYVCMYVWTGMRTDGRTELFKGEREGVWALFSFSSSFSLFLFFFFFANLLPPNRSLGQTNGRAHGRWAALRWLMIHVPSLVRDRADGWTDYWVCRWIAVVSKKLDRVCKGEEQVNECNYWLTCEPRRIDCRIRPNRWEQFSP